MISETRYHIYYKNSGSCAYSHLDEENFQRIWNQILNKEDYEYERLSYDRQIHLDSSH